MLKMTFSGMTGFIVLTFSLPFLYAKEPLPMPYYYEDDRLIFFSISKDQRSIYRFETKGDKFLISDKEFPPSAPRVTSLAVSSDGKYLAVGWENGTLSLRYTDLNSTSPLTTSKELHSNSISIVRFSHDNKHLLSLDKENMLITDLELEPVKKINRSETMLPEIHSASWHPTNESIFLAGDGRLFSLDIKTGEVKKKRNIEENISMDFNLQNNFLVFGVHHIPMDPFLTDRSVWSLKFVNSITFETEYEKPGRSFSFSPDGKKLAIADYNSIEIIDVKTKKEIVTEKNINNSIYDIIFGSNNNFVITRSGSTLTSWYLNDKEPNLSLIGLIDPEKLKERK